MPDAGGSTAGLSRPRAVVDRDEQGSGSEPEPEGDPGTDSLAEDVAFELAFPNPYGGHGIDGLAALVFTILGGVISVELGAVGGAWWATGRLTPAKAKSPGVLDEP
jgi:hypothetical protein